MNSLTDRVSVEYVEAAVKPEHVVVSVDKKTLEIPTGVLSFSNYASLEMCKSYFLKYSSH